MSKLRLDSWKAIADHLNHGVRTVQRWHAEYSLPVYRMGGRKGSVYAYADELDQWLASGAQREENQGNPDLGRRTPSLPRLAPISIASAKVIEDQKRGSEQAERLASELWEVRCEENLQAMLRLYHSAIEQYPDNVAALAGLANSIIFGGLIDSLDFGLAHPSIKSAVDKALHKDPHQLKVQSAVAWTNLLYEQDLNQADRKFIDILRVDPQFGCALFGKALLHLACEDLGEAARFARASWSAEPMGICQGGLASICLIYAGDVDGASRLVNQIELTGGTCTMLAISKALVTIHTLRPSEALTVVQSLSERHARRNVLRGLFGYTLAAAGQEYRAQQVLESLCARAYSPDSWYAKALVMSGLGRIREAVDTLKQRESIPSFWNFGYRTDPLLAPLRNDPKFQEMLSNACRTTPASPAKMAAMQNIR